MGGKARDKVIPASFPKVEGRGTPARVREGQIEELVGGQNPGLEAPLRSNKGQERREQRRCQRRSDRQRSNAEGWMCQGH